MQKWESVWAEIKKSNLISERKRKQNKRCKGTHHKQTNVQPVSKQQVNQKTTATPQFLHLPLFFLLSMILYRMEYPSCQFRSALLAVSFPDLLPTSLGRGGLSTERDTEKAQALPSKVSVCYQHCFSHKPYKLPWRKFNSTPARHSSNTEFHLQDIEIGQCLC